MQVNTSKTVKPTGTISTTIAPTRQRVACLRAGRAPRLKIIQRTSGLKIN